jgi:5'(3')-deoxyribonucleotidase
MDGPVIFLDMDGVVADFFGGFCQAFGLDREDAMKRLAPEDFWFKSLIGDVGQQAFWARIDALGEGFWAGLGPLPHAQFLYQSLAAQAPVCFLSHPAERPFCASGKLRWLGQHFPQALAAQDYVLTKHKHYLAQEGRLLIDDGASHCDHFVRRRDGRFTGGWAVLFPQRWNHRYREFDSGLSVRQVLLEVNRWLSRQMREVS